MKRARLVFATLAAGLTLAVGAAGTAVASTSTSSSDPNMGSQSQCGAYSLCLWTAPTWGDPFWSAPYATSPHDEWTTVDATIDNLSSSLWNNRDDTTWIARYAGGDGQQACLRPGQTYQNLNNWYWPDDTTPVNDSISSYKLEPGKTCPFGLVLRQK